MKLTLKQSIITTVFLATVLAGGGYLSAQTSGTIAAGTTITFSAGTEQYSDPETGYTWYRKNNIYYAAKNDNTFIANAALPSNITSMYFTYTDSTVTISNPKTVSTTLDCSKYSGFTSTGDGRCKQDYPARGITAYYGYEEDGNIYYNVFYRGTARLTYITYENGKLVQNEVAGMLFVADSREGSLVNSFYYLPSGNKGYVESDAATYVSKATSTLVADVWERFSQSGENGNAYIGGQDNYYSQAEYQRMLSALKDDLEIFLPGADYAKTSAQSLLDALISQKGYSLDTTATTITPGTNITSPSGSTAVDNERYTLLKTAISQADDGNKKISTAEIATAKASFIESVQPYGIVDSSDAALFTDETQASTYFDSYSSKAIAALGFSTESSTGSGNSNWSDYDSTFKPNADKCLNQYDNAEDTNNPNRTADKVMSASEYALAINCFIENTTVDGVYTDEFLKQYLDDYTSRNGYDTNWVSTTTSTTSGNDYELSLLADRCLSIAFGNNALTTSGSSYVNALECFTNEETVINLTQNGLDASAWLNSYVQNKVKSSSGTTITDTQLATIADQCISMAFTTNALAASGSMYDAALKCFQEESNVATAIKNNGFNAASWFSAYIKNKIANGSSSAGTSVTPGSATSNIDPSSVRVLTTDGDIQTGVLDDGTSVYSSDGGKTWAKTTDASSGLISNLDNYTNSLGAVGAFTGAYGANPQIVLAYQLMQTAQILSYNLANGLLPVSTEIFSAMKAYKALEDGYKLLEEMKKSGWTTPIFPATHKEEYAGLIAGEGCKANCDTGSSASATGATAESNLLDIYDATGSKIRSIKTLLTGEVFEETAASTNGVCGSEAEYCYKDNLRCTVKTATPNTVAGAPQEASPTAVSAESCSVENKNTSHTCAANRLVISCVTEKRPDKTSIYEMLAEEQIDALFTINFLNNSKILNQFSGIPYLEDLVPDVDLGNVLGLNGKTIYPEAANDYVKQTWTQTNNNDNMIARLLLCSLFEESDEVMTQSLGSTGDTYPPLSTAVNSSSGTLLYSLKNFIENINPQNPNGCANDSSILKAYPVEATESSSTSNSNYGVDGLSSNETAQLKRFADACNETYNANNETSGSNYDAALNCFVEEENIIQPSEGDTWFRNYFSNTNSGTTADTGKTEISDQQKARDIAIQKCAFAHSLYSAQLMDTGSNVIGAYTYGGNTSGLSGMLSGQMCALGEQLADQLGDLFSDLFGGDGDESEDSDGDGIPDDQEKSGYGTLESSTDYLVLDIGETGTVSFKGEAPLSISGGDNSVVTYELDEDDEDGLTYAFTGVEAGSVWVTIKDSNDKYYKLPIDVLDEDGNIVDDDEDDGYMPDEDDPENGIYMPAVGCCLHPFP